MRLIYLDDENFYIVLWCLRFVFGEKCFFLGEVDKEFFFLSFFDLLFIEEKLGCWFWENVGIN